MLQNSIWIFISSVPSHLHADSAATPSTDQLFMCWHGRWDLLKKVLDTILSVHGNQTAYLDLVGRGEHILNVLPGDVLEPWVSPEQEAAAAAATAVPAALSGIVVEGLPAEAPL